MTADQPMPIGFLSEMSALPIHGGGITLKRILGTDLEHFDWFFKTLHFPSEPDPEYSEAAHQTCHWWDWEKNLRPVLGSRIAHRITFNRASRALFAKQKKRLKQK